MGEKLCELDGISIFQALPQLCLILSPEFNILEASDAYLAGTLTIREEVLGKYIFEVFPDNPDAPEANAVANLRRSLETVLITRRPHVMSVQHYDIRLPLQQGGKFETRYWKPINTPVLDEEGQVKYIIHSVEDVTRQIITEKKLVNSEQLLMETKRKMTENRSALTIAENSISRFNADIDQFSFIASHDLKEPLRMIASYSDLLSMRYYDLLDVDGREFVRYIQVNTERMKQLIDGLLTYSITGHELNSEVTYIDCNEVIEEVKKTLARQISDHCALIEYKGLPVIKGIATQIYSLFFHLLENAIKFRTKDDPYIRISATSNNQTWKFAVQDNGIGIDKQYSGKIFQIFQRLNPRGEYSGIGLGLAVSRKIVENHGGKIWMEKPGDTHGTIFYFTLPITKE